MRRSLAEWLQWQQSLNPAGIDLGLERVLPVAQRLGVRQSGAARVVIAGTNGKGSCAAFLGEIYRRGGLRTGVYTSPHLLAYNERIVRLGEPAPDAEICAAFEAVDGARGDRPLTYFEFGTLAALQVFARHALQVEILEVGLGGRLDAVNVVEPDCTLITPISIDHEAWLGSTREAIAAEKAATMRAGRPVVIAEPDPPRAILAHAERVGARSVRAGVDYRWHESQRGWHWQWRDGDARWLPSPGLPGRHQLANAAAALAVVQVLHERAPVAETASAAGIAEARLLGRATRVPGDVETILDVAHNPAGAAVLAEFLRATAPRGSTHVVLGMMRDKRHRETIAALAPEIDSWYVCDLPDPRAAGGAELAYLVQATTQAPAHCHASVPEAYASCRASARPGDRIVICGSFVTVAEALTAIAPLRERVSRADG